MSRWHQPGRCDCPCGFVGGSRNILAHRVNCPAWMRLCDFPNLAQTMLDAPTVAARLYTTYSAAVGGVAYNGDPLPTWEKFSADPAKEKQAKAWIAAAEEALRLIAG